MIAADTGAGDWDRPICVSHPKRPDGKGHEEGAFTLAGSTQGQALHNRPTQLGLERNGQMT